MGPSVFEFFLLCTALLSVAVLFRRLRKVEADRERLLARVARQAEGSHREAEALVALGMLTDEISHFVIAPLTVILGQCELARARGEGGRRLEVIERQARRIADVVGSYRDVGREHCGKLERIDPAQALRESLDAVAGLARERDVTLHEMIEPAPPVEANRWLLSRGLDHLLRAAVEAAPREVGDVTVALGVLPVEGEPEEVAFAVADDGPGVAPEELPGSVGASHGGSRAVPGGGLGYAVASAVARAMGATLVVDSAPGTGTRATLKLPTPCRTKGAQITGAEHVTTVSRGTASALGGTAPSATRTR